MAISSYFVAAGANTALFPENMAPSNVNDGMRTVQSDLRNWYNAAIWIEYGKGDGSYTAAYASASSFTIADADVTAEYHANRRVKITGTLTGTVYGKIASSSYSSPNTTVTVTLDSGSLSSESLTVWLSAIPATNSPIPGTTGTLGDIIAYNIGTSGGTVPLLNGTNTWANAQTFSGNITVTGNASVGGTLGVTGAATLSSTLGVTGAATLSSTLAVSGAVTIGGNTVTSVATSSYADTAAAQAGSSTTTVMNPARTAEAIADDDLLIGNRTSAASANATDEVVVKLTGGGLRRLLLSAVRTYNNTPDFTATGEAIPAGAGVVTIAHGLSAEPRRVEWLFRCGTTDEGWAVDDAIDIMTADTGSNAQTLTLGRNATNLYVLVPSSINFRNKSTSAAATMTKASWTIEVRAWL